MHFQICDLPKIEPQLRRVLLTPAKWNAACNLPSLRFVRGPEGGARDPVVASLPIVGHVLPELGFMHGGLPVLLFHCTTQLHRCSS